MLSNRQSLVRILCLLCIACGPTRSVVTDNGTGDGGSTGDAGGQMTADSGTPPSDGGGVMSNGIPAAGTNDQVDCDFLDVEPNNTPQQATPLGTAMSGDIAVWVNGNNIGGSNTADYFVFETAPEAGTFSFDICFAAPVTGMTATLWKVEGGAEQTPPVGTWNSAMGCVTDMAMAAPLEASTEYLFGLTATGGAGSYAA